MAGKVGDVMMLRDGYGFGLHADRSAIPCLTLAFETQDEAAAARKVVAEAF